MEIITDLILVLSVLCLVFVGQTLYKDSVKNKRKTANPPNNGHKNKKHKAKNSLKEKVSNKDEKPHQIKFEDSKDLLDFEEIIVCNEETGLIKYDEVTYIGLIEVRGRNFNLMSSDERIMLEESFGELLNGIDFPIQFYIQSRKLDLEDYINRYRERISEIKEEIRSMEERGNVDQEELTLKYNQLSYGEELLEYFIQRTLRAELLERKYYLAVKYVHNEEVFEHELSKQEILSYGYSDIQNKSALIIDSLLRSNLRSKLLSPIGIGEVLYAAYNRSASSQLKFRNAVEAGFNHLYTTAKPIEIKKLEREIAKSTEIEENLLKEMEEIQKELGA